MMIEIGASQAESTCYCGEGGQYGPFALQKEGAWAGWPDFGQVMRYFRKKARISTKAFSALYGENIGHSVSERWIQLMEKNNRVPVDIDKRMTIAKLLNIPPMLFGLAVLEDLVIQQPPQMPTVVSTGQTRLARAVVDVPKYQTNIQTFWKLHETSNALMLFDKLETDISELKHLEPQTKGDLLYRTQELLVSDYILATNIVRDQRQFSLAYSYSNEAVGVAKRMQDNDLIATTLFTRGWTSMEWGLYGTFKQGVFQVQQEKIEGAIRDFQEAQHSTPEMHPQLLGCISVFLIRAQATLSQIKGERVPISTLLALDDIAEYAGQQHIEDPYTRVLVTGIRPGFKKAAYIANRATIFLAARLPGKALDEVRELECITEKVYKKDETRGFAWEEIRKANIYMGMEEFPLATQHALQALLACQDINSVTNIAIIQDIYGRLLNHSYKSRDAQELGSLLRETINKQNRR